MSRVDEAGPPAPAVVGDPERAKEREPEREKVWTTLELVRFTTGYFAERGVRSARLDAEVLLAHVLGCRRLDLYLGFDRPVDATERARYRDLIRRRGGERVPVAYLTGEREFWSRALQVTPDVLIPRPETEVLVRAVLDRLPVGPAQVADVGTGSGAIAVALAAERTDLEILAMDVSDSALAVASANFARLGLADRIRTASGALLDAAPRELQAIVSNPPYVTTAALAELEPELAHEPRLALDGGPDGLDVIRDLVRRAPQHLCAGGLLAIEIGHDQASAVTALLGEIGGAAVEVVTDLAGRDRVVCARVGG